MATNLSFLQQRIDNIHADFADGNMTVPEREALLLDLRVQSNDVRQGGGYVNHATFQSMVLQSKKKATKV